MKKTIVNIAPAVAETPCTKRVAAYARVSCGKDTMLHSLAAQIDYYRNYIMMNPEWRFAGVYADESKTGTKDNREQFQLLLTECRSGNIDMVITKSISRFARNTVTLLETVRELKSLGVDVFFEEQNIYTLSAEGEVMLTLLASFAQAESLSCSDNCKWRIRKGFVVTAAGTTAERYGIQAPSTRHGTGIAMPSSRNENTAKHRPSRRKALKRPSLKCLTG